MSTTLKEISVIFFGTPAFAVASLNALVEAGVNVLAVVTAPDKPSGRGLQLQETAVKTYAKAKQLPILQPEKLKDPNFINQLKSYNAQLHVVVAFRMLPEIVWNMPPLGTINVHASLLPKYRGAAPINWAIINGETLSGVSTFKLKHEIDTGNILLQKEIPISAEDNAGTYHDKLMAAGALLLVQTVQQLQDNTLKETPQALNPSQEYHAPKLFKKDMCIDWNQKAQEVINRIRGLSPYPAAFTTISDKTIKIYQAHLDTSENLAPSGTYESDGKNYLRFAASDAWIMLDTVQLEGKKRMDIKEFLRGYRIQNK